MNKKRVIAVEANIKLGRPIFLLCEKMGLDVRVFRYAIDALMAAVRSKPDVMVFDADTPLLGSLDFADVVSRNVQFRSVRLVVVVDETDSVPLRRYSDRGIAVATKRQDSGKVLSRELSNLLQSFVVGELPADPDTHLIARQKGAA